MIDLRAWIGLKEQIKSLADYYRKAIRPGTGVKLVPAVFSVGDMYSHDSIENSIVFNTNVAIWILRVHMVEKPR